MLSRFSWEPDYLAYHIVHARYVLSGLGSDGGFAYHHQLLPPFNHLFRQMAAVSLLRPYFAPTISTGILTSSSIEFSFRILLRTRLTLIRLALIRKPWSFGEEVSNPLYRYLYLHLLFLKIQPKSPLNLRLFRNAPLPV